MKKCSGLILLVIILLTVLLPGGNGSAYSQSKNGKNLETVVTDQPWSTYRYMTESEKPVVYDITDSTEPSIIDYLANGPEELHAKTEYDVIVRDEVIDFVLGIIIDKQTAIVSSGEDGCFDFPKLEVENYGISYRASIIHDGYLGQDVLVVAFFPTNIPSMAACAFLARDINHVEIYLNSTWMMLKKFEALRGKPRPLWSIEDQYLINNMFEPQDVWLHYLLPGENTVPKEDAVSIATDKLINLGYVGLNESMKFVIGAEYVALPNYSQSKEGVWIITYYKQNGTDYSLIYSVEVDGIDKKVLQVQKNGDGLGRIRKPLLLRG